MGKNEGQFSRLTTAATSKMYSKPTKCSTERKFHCLVSSVLTCWNNHEEVKSTCSITCHFSISKGKYVPYWFFLVYATLSVAGIRKPEQPPPPADRADERAWQLCTKIAKVALSCVGTPLPTLLWSQPPVVKFQEYWVSLYIMSTFYCLILLLKMDRIMRPLSQKA